MSFTTDIKKEIISRGIDGADVGKKSRKAALSAFLRTSGIVGIKEGAPNFFIVSETENVAEYFMRMFSETFQTELTVTHATMDRMSGRDKLLLQCPEEKQMEVLKETGLLKRTGELKAGIASSLIAGEAEKIAYVQGAFLGGGSCMLPNENGKTGYHLEVVFPDGKTARDFCRLLSDFELLVKQTERKDTHVVYIKSKEMISDFLAVIGAEHSLKKFSAFLEKRDEANHFNRQLNCMAGNVDRSVKATVKQVVAIAKLEEHGVLETLGVELQQLANTRTENVELSMQELADLLKISKSCLNHRMRRLLQEAEKLKDEEEK
ncbi:MAG: DNA-binding protein WhiA [Clostridia bacterium]|nr:DNA-binding protein WhiA [Clostridia bacterium]